jgi:hypothetical protein
MLVHSESESNSFKQAVLNHRTQRAVSTYSKSDTSILSDDSRQRKNILKSNSHLREPTPNSKRVTFNQEVAQKEIKLYKGESKEFPRSTSEDKLNGPKCFDLMHKSTPQTPDPSLSQSFSFDHLSIKNKNECEDSTEDFSSNKNNSFSSESLDEEQSTCKSTSNDDLPPPPPPPPPSSNDDYAANEPLFPFPLPSYGNLISRTDLNSNESLNNSSSSSGTSQVYSCVNSTSEEMVTV